VEGPARTKRLARCDRRFRDEARERAVLHTRRRDWPRLRPARTASTYRAAPNVGHITKGRRGGKGALADGAATVEHLLSALVGEGPARHRRCRWAAARRHRCAQNRAPLNQGANDRYLACG